jgi:hypothetical protein
MKVFNIDVSEEVEPIETMRELASYENIAISNSTFSWWAAYISDAKKILMPSEWMPNLKTPESLVLPKSVFLPSSFD